MVDPYVYPHSNVIRNKLNIRNEDKLKKAEAEFTNIRMQEMELSNTKFDFASFCDVHHWIFQDVYEWAGEPRTIDVEKEERSLGGLSVEYEKHENVVQSATRAIDKMTSLKWRQMTLDEKARNFTSCLADIWKVHCFREGNTRTTITFCGQYMESQGIPLDYTLFKENSLYMRTALVAANAKFNDLGDLSNPEYLIKIIKDSMERGLKQQIKAHAKGKPKREQIHKEKTHKEQGIER